MAPGPFESTAPFDSTASQRILFVVIDDGRHPGRLQQLLRKSQTMAEELVKENERLRMRVIALEEQCRAAEFELEGLRDRTEEVSPRSAAVIEELRSIEEELNTLANLHTANWQLHLQLALARVLDAIVEICVNLVGTDKVSIYMVDEAKRKLIPVRAYNSDAAVLFVDESDVGNVVKSGAVEVREQGDPVAVVPLSYEERVVGAVVIHHLLVQKNGLQSLDHELFELIKKQGATALYGAYLADVSPRTVDEEAVRKALSG